MNTNHGKVNIIAEGVDYDIAMNSVRLVPVCVYCVRTTYYIRAGMIDFEKLAREEKSVKISNLR